jgi:hypothetical protein
MRNKCTGSGITSSNESDEETRSPMVCTGKDCRSRILTPFAQHPDGPVLFLWVSHLISLACNPTQAYFLPGVELVRSAFRLIRLKYGEGVLHYRSPIMAP